MTESAVSAAEASAEQPREACEDSESEWCDPIEVAELPTDVEAQRLVELRARFAKAPEAELLRFCRGNPLSLEDAVEMYERHLLWRQGHGSPESLRKASETMPQKYIRACGVARDGTRLVLVQGGRYELGMEPMQYVLGMAAVADTAVSRSDMQKVTVLIDVRPAEGWPNVLAHRMVALFRAAANTLPEHYPERIERLIVYPLPGIVIGLWRTVQSFLDPATKSKVEVLRGSAALGAPCPSALGQFVALDQLPADAWGMHQALPASGQEVATGDSQT